jgi:hypothetical protein
MSWAGYLREASWGQANIWGNHLFLLFKFTRKVSAVLLLT